MCYNKIIRFIQELQKDNKKIFFPNEISYDFNFFINNLKEEINNDLIYKTINKINNIEYKKPNKVYLKNSEIAVSDDIIYVTDERYLEKFNKIKNKKFSIVSKKDIENSEIIKKEKILSNKKTEIYLLDAIKNGINKNAEKIELKVKNNQIELTFTKNKLKTKNKITNKILFEENKAITKKIIDYIVSNYNDKKIDIKEKQIDEKNHDFFIIINNVFLIDLDNFGLNKFSLNKLKTSLNEKSGIVFISSESGSGKTTLLKSISKYLLEKEKSISVYTDESSFDEMNLNVYKNKKIKNLSNDDIIIVDAKINNKVFDKIIKKSMNGSLIIISLEAKDFFNTIKIINYNYKVKKELLSDEIIGFLSLQLVRKVNKELTEELLLSEMDLDSVLGSYENYNKNAIVLKEIEEYNEYNGCFVLSEWVNNSLFIRENLIKDFNINKIKIEQKSLDWFNIIEDGLIKLNNKEISLNEFIRSVNIK